MKYPGPPRPKAVTGGASQALHKHRRKITMHVPHTAYVNLRILIVRRRPHGPRLESHPWVAVSRQPRANFVLSPGPPM